MGRRPLRVASVGGGPAGLYAALLLAKANPDHDITVHERYPPDVTFGWGVVFSDATLGRFREADLRSYTQITDSFVRWSAIDIFYRGERLRSDGHAFAAIARKQLLRILQQRCADLGVTLEFSSEVALDDVAGADLVLGVDGIRSAVRDAHGGWFQPRLDERRAKYIWYGTDLVLDSFTFLFRDSPHGLFQVHAYPFDGTRSTFIVETTEETWRRAGLDTADEAESIAYCEALFADHLRGARLLSNQSRWVNFVTVRNARWVHDNVVLLGDAAHTAHFSIGSGTKLAMEDAIALAQAVDEHPDLPTALAQYEKERRPVVERFQDAAQDSLEYFENIPRYTHLEPLQFAFYLLTRSGRITYDSLRLRDAEFVAGVDRWFARGPAAGEGPGPLLVAPPPALTAIRLRAVELVNRVVVAPVLAAPAADGEPGEDVAAELSSWAASGAGLVLTPPLAVTPEGRATPADPGLYRPEHAAAWSRVVKAARDAGPALVGARLGHAGPRGATRPRREGVDLPLRAGGWPLLAASARPYAPGAAVPAAATPADLDAVIGAFARAAEAADDAGFDLLVVDAADGYLLSSFVSPLTNRRDDGYGGPLEHRLRFPLEVVTAVRAAWGEDRPLAVRLTASDLADGGTTVPDAVAAARAFAAAGCDLVEVRAGHTTPRARPAYGPGHLVGYADQIRNEARVGVLVGGGLITLGDVNTVLAAGRADLAVLDPRRR